MGTKVISQSVTCLACGVFKKELEFLAKQGLIDLKVKSLDSMLHMEPCKLGVTLEAITSKHPEEKFVLLYGDCQPRMHEMAGRETVSKVGGINCCEILLGKEAYRKLQRERAFIFLPEWAVRWREIFTKELGFNKPENAKEFMKENLSKLVYLDTGIDPVPEDLLTEIKEFFDMPMQVLPISLDVLKNGIEESLEKFNCDDEL